MKTYKAVELIHPRNEVYRVNFGDSDVEIVRLVEAEDPTRLVVEVVIGRGRVGPDTVIEVPYHNVARLWPETENGGDDDEG